MNQDQVRELLRKRALKFSKGRKSTGVRAWCVHHGIPTSRASEFLNGVRNPTTDILDALGLERSYSRKKLP